jgi:hypothetical protein
MQGASQAAPIRGKTIRLTWTEGPTKGMTHEHVFHEDGTVEWHDVKTTPKASPKEKPTYAALEAAEDIYAVSYLASASGYTLTVVLNFRNHRMVGFASSAKDWHPVQGTFEVVG